MSTLTTTRTYSDTNLLSASDLDAFLNSIETFFNTTKLTDNNFQSAGITASTKVIDGTITTALIGAGQINAAAIADSNVTNGLIADSAFTTAKIADATITGATIANGAITATVVADGTLTVTQVAAANVTRAKLTSFIQISDSCGSFSTTSSSMVNVTNLSCTLTTTGKPVFLCLVADGDTTNPSYIGAAATSLGAATMIYTITRDGSPLFTSSKLGPVLVGTSAITAYFPPCMIRVIDVVSAGTYTYQFQAASTDSLNITAHIVRARLIAWEMK